MKIKVKIPVRIAQLLDASKVIAAIEAQITATPAPARAPRTFTVLVPADIAAEIDAVRKEQGISASAQIISLLARNFEIEPPHPPEMMTDVKVALTPAQAKALDRAVKLAKISKSEFIRRALADAVKTDPV